MTSCAICRHPLADTISRKRRVGPECWERLLDKVAHAQATYRAPLGPFAGDVILVRSGGLPYANVLFRFRPLNCADYDGPQTWGHYGLGTLCLALNILSQFLSPYFVRPPVGWLPDPQADVLAGPFAGKFLINAPAAGCIILQRDILAWLRREILPDTAIHTFGVLA